ncbi:MAG: cytochrome c [Acidobacteriota bacterium]|nr:cytochrome c [Acidobacteriota bacterium]
MLKSRSQVQSPKSKVRELISNLGLGIWDVRLFLLAAFCLVAVGCRYDMQDQPRYKALKKSDFFSDGKAMRELPEGTVARGYLREDKAFYQGKTEAGQNATAPNPAATPVTDASGNTLVTDFSGLVSEFPLPVTAELVDRGEQRYKVFCIVCHGPVGNGDGMIVRRGFSKPPTYNDDRLRNAPVGHFYNVITNGQGKMNSYASQIPPADRWAIVAYIRALQVSQNPNGNVQMNLMNGTNTNAPTPTMNNANPAPAVTATETHGGAR